MNVKALWKLRAGEWTFASLVAWGAIVPWSPAGDLKGGLGCDQSLATNPCTGPAYCTGYVTCMCGGDPMGSGECQPVNNTCPSGCAATQPPSKCSHGPMNECHYPS